LSLGNRIRKRATRGCGAGGNRSAGQGCNAGGNRSAGGDYNAGFVLLEALVVLLIFLMLFGTLLSGISYLIRAQRELEEQNRQEENTEESSALPPKSYVGLPETLMPAAASSRRYSISRSEI